MYLNNPGKLSSGCRHSIQIYILPKPPSTVNFLAAGIEYKAILYDIFYFGEEEKKKEKKEEKKGGRGDNSGSRQSIQSYTLFRIKVLQRESLITGT